MNLKKIMAVNQARGLFKIHHAVRQLTALASVVYCLPDRFFF